MIDMNVFRYLFGIEALTLICTSHYWVFAVQYLRAGLCYSKFNIEGWKFYAALALFLPYYGYFLYTLYELYTKMPIFHPDLTSEVKCDVIYTDYSAKLSVWSTLTLNKYA
jgi:hypothetical protein